MTTKESTVEKKQPNLVDVPTSEAAKCAETYADMCDDIASKKDLLIKQGEKVLGAMKKANQLTLSFTDQYGYKHHFSIVKGLEKLKHSKTEQG